MTCNLGSKGSHQDLGDSSQIFLIRAGAKLKIDKDVALPLISSAKPGLQSIKLRMQLGKYCEGRTVS